MQSGNIAIQSKGNSGKITIAQASKSGELSVLRPDQSGQVVISKTVKPTQSGSVDLFQHGSGSLSVRKS